MNKSFRDGMAFGFGSEFSDACAAAITAEMYDFEGQENIPSPQLIYYKDIIRANTDKVMKLAGNQPERIWPHMKTHKMAAVLEELMARGVKKFKCANIAEMEVAAKMGAEKLILAYPIVGPNIERLIALQKAFPQVECFAIGDDLACARALSDAAAANGLTIPYLVDVNSGFNRTGVTLEKLEAYLAEIAGLPDIVIRGLHWYDAQLGYGTPQERIDAVHKSDAELVKLIEHLRETYPTMDVVPAGGSPEYAAHCDCDCAYVYLSPGTVFIHDWAYTVKYPEMEYLPGGLILSRVVSNPEEGYFTIDCGEKAIAVGNKPYIGVLAGIRNYEEVFQNEEHWVFRMKPGHEAECPKVGDIVHVIPSHICPCAALYPEVPVVENGKLAGCWEVSARNRKINF